MIKTIIFQNHRQRMEVKLPALVGNYDSPADRPINRQTGSHREDTLPTMLLDLIGYNRFNF